MSYQEYLEKTKILLGKSTCWQRCLAALLLLAILIGMAAWINPSKRLLERRNSQRRSDVVNILNSVYQYGLEHDGALPASIGSEPTMLCKSRAASCEGLVDISSVVEDKHYLLTAVPVDPREKGSNSAGYQIARLSSGRISVTAPLAENGAVISLSK